VKQKQTRGRLFQRQLSVPKLFEFEDNFYTVLERVQSETKAIDPELVVREKFGIMRSTRKGQTGHAMNMQINKDLIEAFNRWRKDLESGTRVPRLDMVATYATWNVILPTLLRFTHAL
jgi:hypothetical protein